MQIGFVIVTLYNIGTHNLLYCIELNQNAQFNDSSTFQTIGGKGSALLLALLQIVSEHRFHPHSSMLLTLTMSFNKITIPAVSTHPCLGMWVGMDELFSAAIVLQVATSNFYSVLLV